MQMKIQHGSLASIQDAHRGSLLWQSAQRRFSGCREMAATSAERDILVLVAVLATLPPIVPRPRGEMADGVPLAGLLFDKPLPKPLL